MEQTILKIQGMGCEGCVSSVQNALTELNGVISAEVDLDSTTAKINYDIANVSLSECIAAIENAGYTVLK